MQAVTSLNHLSRASPVVLTVGAFDGVHRGHQYLIRQVVHRARWLRCESMVVTFDPRPEVVLREGSLQLTNAEEEVRLIGALGVDTTVVLKFTQETAFIPAGDFLLSILEHVNLAEFWTGADFAFGHKRQGNVEFLIRSGERNGFAVHVVPREPLGGKPVSSTYIRELVERGDVTEASRFLGHYVGVSGQVVPGYGRGRPLGFPTANLAVPAHQLLPAPGIYAGFVRVDGARLPAAISAGYNPFFKNQQLSVEAYILDHDEELQGRHVGVDFVHRLRDERDFESAEALVEQIDRDVAQTRNILQAAVEPGELLLSV